MIGTIFALIGAVMVGVGLFGLFLSFSSKKGGSEFAKMVLASVALIIIGGWMIFGFVSIFVILRKIFGIFLVFAGVFLLVKFPGGYAQQDVYTKFGMLIGIIMLVFGIYLVLF